MYFTACLNKDDGDDDPLKLFLLSPLNLPFLTNPPPLPPFSALEGFSNSGLHVSRKTSYLQRCYGLCFSRYRVAHIKEPSPQWWPSDSDLIYLP